MAAILFAAKISRYESAKNPLTLRLEWVDRPEHVGLDNHCFLSRCACQLAMITTVMRGYSRSSSKIECSVLDVTPEYGLKAHNVYNHALCRWLERNSKSFARERFRNQSVITPKRERKFTTILQTRLQRA